MQLYTRTVLSVPPVAKYLPPAQKTHTLLLNFYDSVEWNRGRLTWTEGRAEGLVSDSVLLHVLNGSGAVGGGEEGREGGREEV